MRKGNAKRIMSGFLATLTVLSTMMQPVTSFAAEVPSDGTVPLYKDVADMLDADEVVVAHDHEVSVGSTFDIEVDFSGIEIPGNDKVKVKFQKAMNDEGESFTTNHEDSYEAVYYVEPQKTDHPTYQISRTITVKEEKKASSETVAEASSQTTTENDSGGGTTEDTTEDDDSDSESSVVPDDVEQITDEAFDAEIESTENQETVDPETGTSLSEVLEEAVEQDVNLAELEVGETVTFEMPMLFAATGNQSVSITRGSWYHYADYGLGSYITAPYYVTWGGIKATAYCVQPSKTGPDDGTYSITKLSDGKTLAKVCYYGTKASDENGFFDEKHPDFSTGKRFIITHIAAAYANGSSDWDSGTNATGRSLAKELYNYCVSMPDIPDVDMSFSDDNVKAYVEGNVQRTKTITFKADTLQTITFKLPAGVKLVNVSTGKTSAAGASVEISGGTQFYLQAPLTQAEDVKATFSATMKGSIDKEYSAYKISTGSGTQDLALVFGEGVGNEKYVDFKVTWTKECYVSLTKKDSETSNALAGAVYGIYSDEACTKLITQMPATDKNGSSKVTIDKTQEVVYLKEISVPTGYVIDTKSYNVTLNIGKTTKKNVTDQRVRATIKLTKQDSETGAVPQGDATLENAVYGLYAREDIVHPDGTTGVLHKAGTLIINKGMSESQTMKTAIHECAHSLLHDKDIMMSNHVEKDRMTKEIEAESCAFCVCAAFNLDTGDYSFPYISGWSKEHDMKELKGSLDLIRKTSGEFIDKVTQEMQAIIEERTKAVEVQMEGTITFYVAECMEFPVMGEFHDGLSLDEAIKVYESIPSDRMHGIKGIGFDLQDDSIYSGQYELFSGGKVLYDSIDLVEG